jgi:hypothetical protein
LAKPAATRFDRLVAALQDPGCYPHPVHRIELLQNLISVVLLTGSLAYNIKPVDLGFLDFSTLWARRLLRAELRLNRRTAPALHRRRSITGARRAAIGGGGARSVRGEDAAPAEALDATGSGTLSAPHCCLAQSV